MKTNRHIGYVMSRVGVFPMVLFLIANNIGAAQPSTSGTSMVFQVPKLVVNADGTTSSVIDSSGTISYTGKLPCHIDQVLPKVYKFVVTGIEYQLTLPSAKSVDNLNVKVSVSGTEKVNLKMGKQGSSGNAHVTASMATPVQVLLPTPVEVTASSSATSKASGGLTVTVTWDIMGNANGTTGYIRLLGYYQSEPPRPVASLTLTNYDSKQNPTYQADKRRLSKFQWQVTR